MQPIQFSWSDGWLLASILDASGPGGDASLGQVMAAGDELNHAIFTVDEINGGLDRLVRSGYVQVESDRLVPTAKALDLYTRAGGNRQSQFELRRKVGELIGTLPWPETVPDREGAPAYFDAESIRKAWFEGG